MKSDILKITSYSSDLLSIAIHNFNNENIFIALYIFSPCRASIAQGKKELDFILCASSAKLFTKCKMENQLQLSKSIGDQGTALVS